VVGYFQAWGIYDQGYTVKTVATSGAAPRLTHLNYAFANLAPAAGGSQVVCQIADPYADYQKSWTAAESVDGVAVPASAPLRGNFQQLRALKSRYPNLKVMISLGGWTGSQHFSDMAVTPESRTAFVSSCVDLFLKGNLPRAEGAGGPGAAAGLFDGIDIDWEFPGACGNTCDFRPADGANFTSLVQEFRRQLAALRQQSGKRYWLTMAASATPDVSAHLELSRIQASLDFLNLMAYDVHGTWDRTTNFHAPLFRSPGDPARDQGLTISEAVQGYLEGGVPASKLVLGTPFYGRGWGGVPRTRNGLYQSNTGPAEGSVGPGFENFAVLQAKLAAGGWVRSYDRTVQNAWLYNPATREFWSYDDEATQRARAAFVKAKKLGGMMIWELGGDARNGALIQAIAKGLR
jgi:chitinase